MLNKVWDDIVKYLKLPDKKNHVVPWKPLWQIYVGEGGGWRQGVGAFFCLKLLKGILYLIFSNTVIMWLKLTRIFITWNMCSHPNRNASFNYHHKLRNLNGLARLVGSCQNQPALTLTNKASIKHWIPLRPVLTVISTACQWKAKMPHIIQYDNLPEKHRHCKMGTSTQLKNWYYIFLCVIKVLSKQNPKKPSFNYLQMSCSKQNGIKWTLLSFA